MLITSLDEAHQFEFDTLCAFDEMCKQHDIIYQVDFGVLLGMVREKDFIAWDDDIDVSMTRENFNKLISLGNDIIPAGFELELPCSKGYFFDFIPHFINHNYTVVRTEKEQYHEGVDSTVSPWMDIFIIDDAKPGFKQKIRGIRQKWIFGLARGHRQFFKELDPIGEKAGFLMKFVAKVLAKIGSKMSLAKLNSKYERLQTKFTGCDECYYSNAMDMLYITIDKRLFTETVPMLLRGREFPVPKRYPELLELDYGDYMTPPPEDKRIPIHFYVDSDSQKE